MSQSSSYTASCHLLGTGQYSIHSQSLIPQFMSECSSKCSTTLHNHESPFSKWHKLFFKLCNTVIINAWCISVIPDVKSTAAAFFFFHIWPPQDKRALGLHYLADVNVLTQNGNQRHHLWKAKVICSTQPPKPRYTVPTLTEHDQGLVNVQIPS